MFSLQVQDLHSVSHSHLPISDFSDYCDCGHVIGLMCPPQKNLRTGRKHSQLGFTLSYILWKRERQRANKVQRGNDYLFSILYVTICHAMPYSFLCSLEVDFKFKSYLMSICDKGPVDNMSDIGYGWHEKIRMIN